MPTITPTAEPGDYRTAEIFGLTADEITAKLGFAPNVTDDPTKVSHSWGFIVDGERCGVWSWKGSEAHKEFSAFGPMAALVKVFGKNVN